MVPATEARSAESQGLVPLTRVSRALQQHIFERFGRADDARGSATGGTGLGLAIARELVSLHGGSLALDADRDYGARFVVRIPSPQARP